MIHDIALQSLPVRIMMDRGGFVGNDGPTHHGVFDFSYLRLIPGFVHMAPKDEREMRRMMLTAWKHDSGPIVMRYPRGETEAMGAAVGMSIGEPLDPIPVGEGELLRDDPNPDLLLVAIGSMVKPALRVAEDLEQEGIGALVVNARFVKPLDEKLLLQQIRRVKGLITIEENVLAGGMGEAVLRLLAERDALRPARLLGAPDRFVSFGNPQDQLKESGLLPGQILDTAVAFWRTIGAQPSRRRQLPA
jgi:1-deoxy-D-xylulose-5-phosphate synthase